MTNENLNSYLILYVDGLSEEVEAQFYERDAGDWVFTASGVEVLRTSADRVASISKAR
ncbi:MAG: hypothetical protein QOI81_1788 [Actinomycetota bacterium]|jgi:hypothetical protein|nr:hypothetical protein [Actinomycetota bacterium]